MNKIIIGLISLAVICIMTLFILGFNGARNDKNPEKSYKVVIIEQCEYIYISRRPFSAEFCLSHKGNCKNPIHIYVDNKK